MAESKSEGKPDTRTDGKVGDGTHPDRRVGDGQYRDDKIPAATEHFAGQIRQAKNELENAEAAGQTTRVAAARKLLAGYSASDRGAPKTSADAAAAKRAAESSKGDTKGDTAPAERATRQDKQGTTGPTGNPSSKT